MFLDNRGVTILSKFFLSQYQKICRKILPGFRKILVSKLLMHERGVSRFPSLVKMRLKDVSKDWDSNPYLTLLNPALLPTVPWEPLEILTNVSEIIKKYDTTETRTRTYRFRTLLSLPHRCHLFLNKKSWQFWTETKRPYFEWAIFSLFAYAAKINNPNIIVQLEKIAKKLDHLSFVTKLISWKWKIWVMILCSAKMTT